MIPETKFDKNVRGQHGGARLRATVWLFLLASFVFVCFKIVPPYFANYQFEDWLHTQIPFFMVNQMPSEKLRAAIVKEMKAENIPAGDDNIKIIQNNANGINVEVDYNVPVDLMVYKANLHFTPSMNSQSLVQ